VVISPGSVEQSRSLATLNDACSDDWRIARIHLSNTETSRPSRVVVTIERDDPQSLFAFG